MEVTSLERAVVEAMRSGAYVTVQYAGELTNQQARDLLEPFADATGWSINKRDRDGYGWWQTAYNPLHVKVYEPRVTVTAFLRQGPPEPKPEPDPVGEKIDEQYDAQF